MFSTIYSITIFHEYTFGDPVSLSITVAGVALMIVAASVLGKAGAHENERAFAYDNRLTDPQRKRAMTLGWVYSGLTAFLLWLVLGSPEIRP